MFVPSSSSKQRESDYSLAKSRGKMCNSRQVRIQRRRAMDLVIIWRIFWQWRACKLSNGITTAMTKYIWMCSTVHNKRLHISDGASVYNAKWCTPTGFRLSRSVHLRFCIRHTNSLEFYTIYLLQNVTVCFGGAGNRTSCPAWSWCTLKPC